MRIALLLALCFVLFAAPGRAAEVGGVELPDTELAGSDNLTLNGIAMRRAFFLDIYAAGLYLPAKASDARAILEADAPRRMVMHFLREVDTGNISGAWLDGLNANTPDASQELHAQFLTLNSWMESMAAGDEMRFTYLPGQGVSVEVKGAHKGVLPGKAFADALLSCWLGSKPGPGESFKKALLGGK